MNVIFDARSTRGNADSGVVTIQQFIFRINTHFQAHDLHMGHVNGAQ